MISRVSYWVFPNARNPVKFNQCWKNETENVCQLFSIVLNNPTSNSIGGQNFSFPSGPATLLGLHTWATALMGRGTFSSVLVLSHEGWAGERGQRGGGAVFWGENELGWSTGSPSMVVPHLELQPVLIFMLLLSHFCSTFFLYCSFASLSWTLHATKLLWITSLNALFWFRRPLRSLLIQLLLLEE